MDEEKEPEPQEVPLVKTAWRKVPRRLLTPEEAAEYERVLRELYNIK